MDSPHPMRDVDDIIRLIKELCPNACITQLKVLHPGNDDDGIWFFSQPDSEFEVQIESPNGMCPFLIETDENDSRIITDSIEKTIDVLSKLLYIAK